MEKMEDGKQPGPPPKRARESEEISIKMKIFNDSIHGLIELHPLLVKIIDTPQFQRLRHIKQLGVKYLVFPGAMHTRFEHSIGVAHLARSLVKTLQEKQPEVNITDRDILCVEIAGLCHDMGHGPFSHLFDGKFMDKIHQGSTWTHEDASVKMFQYMVDENGLRREMEKYDLIPDQDIPFIKELIKGVDASAKTWPEDRARPESKYFLYEIVANKRNGIDVDKWDYFTRDCHHLGIPNGFDFQRLLKTARVCKVEIGDRIVQSISIINKVSELEMVENKVQTVCSGDKICQVEMKKRTVCRLAICFRDKVADDVYDMFYTRYTLHRQALQHRIGNIIEDKIVEVLWLANDQHNISAAKENMADYTKLTDAILEKINREGPQNARDILNNIVERQLPKFVGDARLKDKPDTRNLENNWRETWNKYILEKGLIQDGSEFTVDVVDMGFGAVGENPLDNVHFYNKGDPDKGFKIEKYQASSLKPVKYHEWLVRVYYSNTLQDYQDIQQDAVACFHSWCETNRHTFIDFTDGNFEKAGITPRPVPKNNKKIFNDSIHGLIELHPLLVKIIDTPQFQRLRHIKQLGETSLVFPGAVHTRFEHSIGMAHLAGCLTNVLLEKLNENQDAAQNQDGDALRDTLCVQIAALCYNLGHGPFSYLFEQKVRPYGGDWNHKMASVQMFQHMVETNALEFVKEMREYGLNPAEDIPFIKELMEGVNTSAREWPAHGRTEDKSYLYEIVANQFNGIDVRRWDYFARDCYHLGLPKQFDHQRLLKFARVCDVEGRKHICFRDKVADNVYDMFYTRYTLYRKAYKHRIGEIIKEMISKAFISANRRPQIYTNEGHSNLTDYIFQEIMHSTNPELIEAQCILQDVVHRRLPKFVGEAQIIQAITEAELKRSWTSICMEKKLNAQYYQIHVVDLGFDREGDPIEKVYFYNKNDPNRAFKIKNYQMSSLRPLKYHERLVRVYYTNTDPQIHQKSVLCFQEWCRNNITTFIDSV